MRFKVLGPLEVKGESGPVALGGPKQRAVLAHLIVRANQVIPTDVLVDQVWGEEPPEAVRNTLQTYVSRLRKLLGPDRLEGRTPGYVLHLAPDELDASRFEQLLREARAANGQSERAAGLLRDALGLWTGPAFADLAAEESLSGEIARLEELRLQALEERLAADLDAGRAGEVIGELEALTREHPLRESLWASLMIALYRTGRQADALADFQRARQILADELGVDPSPDLQRLQERILRQDPELELKGEPLRGYRLLEQIGEGAFGVVYRATQPQVGREVAIKAVHPELANHPDFVRRFEREAQLVARLEHPYIVPLYDYWREPDAAYLVMRYLRGGSLADLIEAGPLDATRAARILDQVASALTAAHRSGVVHRDVKPGNVLLDEEGNAYLTDFGVALDEGSPEKTMGTMMRGTPGYLSPEQIRLEPTAPQSDVYALGIVLYEMLAGAYPFPETSLTALLDLHLNQPLPSIRDVRPDLSPAVASAIERATAKNRASRFPDALELAAAFRAALEGGPVVRDRIGDIRNPYKGLRAFLEADAADFFGREKVTERIVRRLAQDEPGDRFLALVGPSGSGKSSVVRAGVVPALRRGALPGSGRWYVVDIHPGSQPLRELESALLAVAVEPPPSLLEELEADELGLVRAAATVLPDAEAELVVVLDQFEELFTLVADEDERSHVLASLRAAALDPESRVRVIATLRADFYDQPLSVPGFGDLLAARNEAITPMTPEELERAIAAPADRAGLVVEPMLLAAMIADVADRPGALPLLQYALTELAEREQDGVLTLRAYREIGGVSGALARRAEQLYEGMNEIGRIACRQLFLRLVALGEGSEDTRRRVRRSEVLPLTDAQAMDGVIESFGRHRLLSFDRDPSSREPTIEIAHEALIGAWARLHGWIDEARDDIRTQRQLSAAAADWNTGARDQSFLLRGARLEQVAAWAETSTLAMSDEDREFVEASVQQRDSELAEHRATEERERALEQRSVRRLRGLVTVVVAALLVASTLTVVAVSQRNRAQREGRIATSRELAAAAVSNLDVDPQRSLLLALAAVDASGSDAVLPEVEEALRRAVVQDREVLTIQGLPSALFTISPDGNFILTRSGVAGDREPADLVVREATTGAAVHRLEGEPGGFYDARWSPDGSRVIALTPDATLIAWETGSWSREWSVDLGRERFGFGGIELSPNGRLLAVAGQDGIVSIVNADTGHEERRLTAQGRPPLLNVAFSPDGSRVGAATNFGVDPVPIWDVDNGDVVLELGVEDAFGIAFSPDGRTITTSGSDGRIQTWDARNGAQLGSFDGHKAEVWGVAYSPDGRLLASVGDDGVRVWDSADHEELLNLHGHDGTVFGVRFAPDGRHLVTSGADGTVRVWDVSAAGSHELLTIGDWWGGFGDADFSPDGARLATFGETGFRQWEAHIGSPVSAAGPDGWGGFSFGPEGERYVTEGRPVVGEAEPGGALQMMENEEDKSFWSAAYSPDGTTVAGGVGGDEADPGRVYVWDVETGKLVWTLGEAGADYDHIRGVAYSPDGKLLAGLAASGGVHLWDLSSGKEVRGWDAVSDNAEGIAFSPDGSLLVTSGADGATVWRSASGEPVVRLRGHASDVPEVAFSPDGTMVATAGEDGTARVWDATTGRQLHVLFGHREGLNSVAFSPDGRSVVTSSDDGTVREYYLDLDELIRDARSRLTRTLTSEECQSFLHASPCPSWAPRPDHIDTQPAPGPGLEGTFRVTIARSDLDGSITDEQTKQALGQYTLSMFDGNWWLHQEAPSNIKFNDYASTGDSSGSYTTDGETVTFTDLADPECFGASWSEHWALNGTALVMSDTSPAPSPNCTGQQVSKWTGIWTWDRRGKAWARTVFEAPGWSRID